MPDTLATAMLAESLINPTIPTVSPSDDAASVLEVMADALLPELPMVEGGRFVGIAREANLVVLPNDDLPISGLPIFGVACSVRSNQHFFDVLHTAAEHKSNLVAVLDQDGAYAGAIVVQDVAQLMGQSLCLQIPGGVLVLAVKVHDYSLAEISRLIEGNNARVLNAFIEQDPDDAQMLRVTVRINQTDLSRIINTLERFGYNVTARFHHSDAPDLDQERLDSLMRFLNI